jgi:hypothetical protein
MWSWLKKYKNGIFNVIAVAGTVVAGLLTGPVGVAVTAIATIAGKLAASPIDHQDTTEQAHVENVQAKKLTAAVEAAKQG